MQRTLERLDRAQQRFHPLALPIAVFKRFGEHGGGRLVTAISYWGFFSIFPLMLVFVTVLNIVLADDPGLRRDLVDGALGQVPVIGRELADSQSALTGSWAAVAVGAATSLWAGLGAANALQNALDEVWDTPMFERPNGAIKRLRSVAFLVVLAVGLSASTLAISATAIFDSSPLTFVLGHVVTLATNVTILLVTFRLLISGPNSWRELLPGAVSAGVLLLVLQSLGRWVVARYIAGASDTYGTFAIVIALLSWFFLVARFVVMGAELNAVLAHGLAPRSLVPSSPMTDGDRRALHHDQRRVQRDRRVGVAMSVGGDEVLSAGST